MMSSFPIPESKAIFARRKRGELMPKKARNVENRIILT